MSFISPTCNSNGAGGINLSNSDTTSITNADVRHNTGRGIYLFQSDRCEVSGCNVYGNTQEGIYLQCDYARIHDNQCLTNTHGIRCEFGGSTGSNNRIYNNIVSGPSDTFVNTDVDDTNDRITLTAHDFVTEDPVQLSNSGGALPTGLSASTTYYVKKVADDDDTIELYSDSALTSIVDITGQGTGTQTITTANTTAALLDTVSTNYKFNNFGGDAPRTFGAADTTPTVLNGSLFKTGGAVTITDFDDGVVGQTITILAAHAVTITDGASIILNGSGNFAMAASDTLTLTMFDDQVWQEVARSDNS
jgi:parallel beta-helix repeat protein